MLWIFILDLWQVIRFRYPIALIQNRRRYSISVYIAILLVLGVSDSALLADSLHALDPKFSLNTRSILILSLGIALIKWLSMSSAAKIVLRKKAPKYFWAGFVLLTQSLSIIGVLAIYSPMLATLMIFWQFWSIWVQFKGFQLYSDCGIKELLFIYGLYALFSILISALYLSVLASFGMVNMLDIQHFLELLSQTRQ